MSNANLIKCPLICLWSIFLFIVYGICFCLLFMEYVSRIFSKNLKNFLCVEVKWNLHAYKEIHCFASLIFVSTLDGKISALDAINNGQKQWSLDFNDGPMLSSNIHNREVITFLQMLIILVTVIAIDPFFYVYCLLRHEPCSITVL